MACSKIFSGNLPELLYEIIQNFRKDLSTLYSCILVNRLWCRLAIPLLWEDPFSVPAHHYRCIATYLCFLNEDNKAKLIEYGISNNVLSSNTLFNYPSFIKNLDTNKIRRSIIYWMRALLDITDDMIGYLVYRSLFEVFIENEGNLHTFEIVISKGKNCKNFNDNIDLILQNPNLTCNIRNLVIFCDAFLSQNIISLLEFLYSNCNSISSMFFNFTKCSINDITLFKNYILQIIISQHNLKQISFELDPILYKTFLSLKNYNCSNTLNTIIFCYIDFTNILGVLQEVFNQLNVLESIHICYCRSLNFDFVQQIIKVIKPLKLKSLFLDEILHIQSLLLLLQKFCECLENFGFGFTYGKYDKQKQQLFEFIMRYCKNIKYFDFGFPNYKDIYLFIKNNQNTINYITIEVNLYEDTIYKGLSLTVLQNLGQVLPSKLEYLCLSLPFIISDLEIFLKNSQNTFIKKLLIKNMGVYNDKKLFINCMKEYIMKPKRVKYLAIFDGLDLFWFKTVVNEFKLHNIIVHEYCDLYITVYDFV
ncbi:hypothetical protein GLOIN_2v1771277 [Rhizophagus irregularis DAOM 181602=DAOM 197198]|nr:hypothetical protein GLOIN_2v1771277 [Rhizophagus irregularis DAOM 181602=DAOM 197198]PKY28123.1 hypothetical protein RhiirB3_444133 [Rhizophagus irregularis]POG74448.1 hypothetical protein GLOIN_2v1771277 [Rhizophagus irregularis DAOM 181602=DAOM 197198]CAB5110340.1 unnamed protein product [Rhizophagus irregularis]|eukprot:XP_025181314.1 hypothetical protein GLOIN_2v1771277 [Rhizophagus irregularis DAOM 181602=DAOM 197198]